MADDLSDERILDRLLTTAVRASLVEPGTCMAWFQSNAGYSDDIIRTMTDQYGPVLDVNDIADTIHYIVSQPPHINLCDVVVRAAHMNYP